MTFKSKISTRKGALGATLITVLAITALLAAAMGVLFATILSSSKGTGAAIQRRKAFYVCDGISKGLAVVASDYFAEDSTPTEAELKSNICSRLGGCSTSPAPSIKDLTPAGYETTTFNITYDGSTASSTVPSGPFEGMEARINTITMDFETVAKHGDGVCSIEETLSLGNIALFQFIAFSEHGMDLSDCTTTKVEGRVHVNGDFCGGCGNELYAKIERLTASGSVFKKNNCSRYNSTSTDFINFKDKGTPDWVLLTKDATDSNWHNLAIQMFGGNVQDKSHGVPELKVPFVAQPEMQPGKDEQRNEHSNEDSMRFYVDPPGIYEDDAISEERLAWKADIRIIDGVWYKNDGTFPGKPIWSDHPGKAKTVTVTDGFVPKDIEVGQDDIKTLYSYPKIPRRYSYYEYDKSNAELCESTAGSDCGNEDHVGVISYGTLFRDGTDPLALEWTPGFWRFHLNTEAALGQTAGVVPPATAKRDVYCGRNLTGDPYTGDSKIENAKTHDCYYEDSSSNWHTAEKGSNYLEAARSGFDDPRVHLGWNEGKDKKRGRMLPINFDIKQFTDAMNDTTKGELGSHFAGGQDFNGIVWIGSSWDKQMDMATPALWPYNDDGESHINLGTVSINADSGDSSATDTFADYAKVQRALPYPLCSDNLGYDPGNTRKPFGGLNGKWDGTVSPVENISAFSIPKCNGNQTSVPNAVRIHNGATINKSVFPDGLTIGTNLPGYILGDLNTSSDVDADWVPFLFAADAITGVSNNWKDDRAPWEDGHSNVSGYKPSMKRPAMDTRWRAAMFFGHVWPTTKHGTGAGLQNWVRFIEDWDLPAPGKKTCIIDGSLVVGFSSVFENQSFWSGGIAYRQPYRTFRFDERFNSFSNQPPGAPTFSVTAVKDWKRN